MSEGQGELAPEISDLIVRFDPTTLERQPVKKADVVEVFERFGNERAVRIVEAIADQRGVLDTVSVDRLLISVHCEMQRISEEFQHGQRTAELVRALIAAARENRGTDATVRLADIGCGTGYVLRWLAARRALGAGVELIGADYNRALIDEATRLAAEEKLDVSFRVANAFQLEGAATLYSSTGVVHHFRGPELVQFFAGHERAETEAFVHFDFQPSPYAALGAWLFHAVRMRHPLAQHDGVLSAERAHSGETLIAAAKAGAPGFTVAMYGQRLGGLPVPRAMQAIVGVRPARRDAFVRALGGRASRLGAWS